MNMLPSPSTATPPGASSWALVAAAPSPETPPVPVPAKVLMSPAAAKAVPPDTTVTTNTTTPTKPQRRTCSMLSSVLPPVGRDHGAAIHRYHGTHGSDGRLRTQTVPLPRGRRRLRVHGGPAGPGKDAARAGRRAARSPLCRVGGAGGPAVGPGDDVVGVAPAPGCPASVDDAAAVANGEGGTERRRDDS